jgi:DNA-binding response OmpR family regulator
MSEKLHALVVDDEESLRRMLELALRGQGWSVTSVGTAGEAQQLGETQTFDALLVDKNLPDFDGVELVRRVREHDDATVCVIFTAYATTESAVAGVRLDIDAYIVKPIVDIYALSDKLRELIRKRRQSVTSRRQRPSGPLRVLVASADPHDREVLAAWFASTGDRVEYVAASGEVIPWVLQGDPELLIIDATLRHPDVPALLEELHAGDSAPACVILVDEDPALQMIIDLIDLDVKAILHKPLDSDELDRVLDRVARLLRGP